MAEHIVIDTLWGDDVELQVGIGLGATWDNILTLDAQDASGKLDSGLLGSPDSPFDDSTCDVRSLTWQSGATRTDGVLTRWEAGSCAIVLDNRDGKYNPTDSPNRIVPMVPVRIRARRTGASTWVPMFYGYADDWLLGFTDDGDATVTLTATDGTKLLSAYDGPEQAAVGAGDTAAQRASRILDECEWTGPRAITAGGSVMQSTTMANDGWSQLLLNTDTELGDTYIDGTGALVFKPRSLPTGAEVPTVIWGPSDARYEHAHILNDDTNLRNIVDAARANGTEQHVRDNDSVARYLPHRYSRNDLMFAGDPDALTWAQVVLAQSADPLVRVDQLDVLPQTQPGTLWDVILNAKYRDPWRVIVQPPGWPMSMTVPTEVRGWVHAVDGESWRVTYALSERPRFPGFVLDADTTQLDLVHLTP